MDIVSIAYERKLDPAWYFGLWQRHAAKLMGNALIDNLEVAGQQARDVAQTALLTER